MKRIRYIRLAITGDRSQLYPVKSIQDDENLCIGQLLKAKNEDDVIFILKKTLIILLIYIVGTIASQLMLLTLPKYGVVINEEKLSSINPQQ